MTSSGKVYAVVEQLSLINPHTNAKDLPEVSRPEESSIPRCLPSIHQIPYVQNVITELSYNFLPRTFFCLDKHRSLQSILSTSKEILTEALPIRCLEATFVGLYLTHRMKGVDRIPLSFKSRANGHTYHHIVLVIRCDGMYGALGLSRKSTLMHKPMIYTSLFDLVMEYQLQYEAVGHRLVDIKLGLCVTHNARSRKAPCWRYVVVRLETDPTTPHAADDAAVSVPAVLARYAELVAAVSAQYDRHAAPAPPALRDLDGLDGADARAESRRRLEQIRAGRAPPPPGAAKKRAASREPLPPLPAHASRSCSLSLAAESNASRSANTSASLAALPFLEQMGGAAESWGFTKTPKGNAEGIDARGPHAQDGAYSAKDTYGETHKT